MKRKKMKALQLTLQLPKNALQRGDYGYRGG